MKNIFALVAIISCGICIPQESAVEVQQWNTNTQKKKSYLQGQIENPNSRLYNPKKRTADWSALENLGFNSVTQDIENRIQYNRLKSIPSASLTKEQKSLLEELDEQYKLEQTLEKQAELDASQNETLKEILAQEKKDEQLLYNISKEKESEIKQIISQRVKINQLKIEEAENKIFRNKIMDYSILLIVALLSVFIIIRIIKLINFREISNNVEKIQEYGIKIKLPKLSRNEIYFISFSTGAILSMILGNLFPAHDYYRLSRKQGQAIKVSEGLSTYSIESFNYSIAIITFLLVSLTFYFILTKANDKK